MKPLNTFGECDVSAGSGFPHALHSVSEKPQTLPQEHFLTMLRSCATRAASVACAAANASSVPSKRGGEASQWQSTVAPAKAAAFAPAKQEPSGSTPVRLSTSPLVPALEGLDLSSPLVDLFL